MKINDFYKNLIRRYGDNKASDEELEIFFHLMNEGKLEKELEEVMNEDALTKETGGIISPFYKRTWFRIAAAAVLILIAGTIYLLVNKTNNQQPIAGNQQQPIKDVAPGGNKAVLTLADGSTIILDNAANGTVSQQGNTKILKLGDGQLAYNSLNEKPKEVLYNTITTPRGGQYQMILSDGSGVWLNAASSIRFPVAFTGNVRKVEITGEAYFEVAKNPAMPFIVSVAGKSEVEVLGTHFNINSYVDEATINTSLLEGSVKITELTTFKSRVITPGQQAQLNSNGQININTNTDLEEVMAWKNGKFDFGEATDVKTIMRQLARWYNVDVEYRGVIKEHIGGKISRNVNVSKVFEMLGLTGIVRFEIDGKKVIVMPGKRM
jgi:transmembrane sensor